MALLVDRQALAAPQVEREKALKILAKSIFRELRTNGYQPREILALSTELLGLVSTEIRPAGLSK
jgi:hypothetical protein